jgi:hypothetical protein
VLLQIHSIFGESRSFRGNVEKFALEHTPYGLNPDLAVGDKANDPTANRQGQRDMAVTQASGATLMAKQAAGIEKTFEHSMDKLIGVLTHGQQVDVV